MKEVMTAEGIEKIINEFGLDETIQGASTGTRWLHTGGSILESHSPINGELIGRIQQAGAAEYEKIIEAAALAFQEWRKLPAPRRGDIVRQMGDELRKYKEPLGMLVSYEMGKIYQEGLGEVQEMIDICDYALGLSRQLYGLTMHSERPEHRMYEQYHPLGIVGVISAFNFPVAVWSWNTMIALVCGDVSVWKPSKKVPLSAVACQKIIAPVLQRNGVPEGVSSLIVCDHKVSEQLIADKRIPLVSVTGSTRVGRRVASVVGERLGRTILELGGNNAIIITPDADLKMAIQAVLFGAVGTAGQRCTTTRRLIIHESIYESFKASLLHAYGQVRIGNPLHKETLMGPIIDKDAVKDYLHAIEQVKMQGGKILYGGKALEGKGYESGCYVMPTIAEVMNDYEIVQHETFAPILYLIKYKTFDEALALQNGVPQGLSSSVFSKNLIETEKFLSHSGSDCGIANVNIGTSGAEIGGAFGGEKDTGGGRESGSDAWKAYMRRQTNTINYGTTLPLAQGINFHI
ncbi:MAG: aldehyde dehydrogenase family protein [Bacteroidia bacterium]|nr:aldehyde dehydrogenase family protein [Bacteroidia bacterium]